MSYLRRFCDRIPLFFWFVLIGVFYYVQVAQNLFVCDDFGYAMTKDNTPISGLGDIISTQTQHYQTTNGRFLVHSVVMMFAGIGGMSAFRICSSIIFVVLIYELYVLCGRRNRALIPIFLLSIMLLPAFNITFWGNIATVTNYLWTAVFFFAYLIGLENARDTEMSRTILVLFAAGAFVSGALQESFSIGATVGSLALLWRNRNSLSIGLLVIIFFYCLGAFFVVFAPANFQREMHSLGDTTIGYRIVANTMNIISEGYAFIGLFLLVLLSWVHKKQETISFISNNIHLFVFIAVSILFGILVAFNGHHQLTGAYLCVVVLVCRWMLSIKNGFYSKYRYCLSCSSLAILVVIYPLIYNYRVEVHTAYQQMCHSAENAADGFFYSQKYDSISYHNRNWLQEHFTSSELNQDFPIKSASLFFSKGKNASYLTTRLPYSKERLVNMCSSQNFVSDHIYHQDGTLVYVFCFPIDVNPDDFLVRIEQHNSRLGYIRNILAHRPSPGTCVSKFKLGTLPSFLFEDKEYYVLLYKEEFFITSAEIESLK